MYIFPDSVQTQSRDQVGMTRRMTHPSECNHRDSDYAIMIAFEPSGFFHFGFFCNCQWAYDFHFHLPFYSHLKHACVIFCISDHRKHTHSSMVADLHRVAVWVRDGSTACTPSDMMGNGYFNLTSWYIYLLDAAKFCRSPSNLIDLRAVEPQPEATAPSHHAQVTSDGPLTKHENTLTYWARVTFLISSEGYGHSFGPF